MFPHHPATFHPSHHPNILAAMPIPLPPQVICPRKPLQAFEDTTSYQGTHGVAPCCTFDERIPTLKITSVPVVAVEELLYLPVGLWMLNTRWYQLYPKRFDMPLEPAVPLLVIASSVCSKLASIVQDQRSHRVHAFLEGYTRDT
ncbi:hypothetical protein C5S39_03840 [Candidatus Methanophagaceae archaeon]|nr:hypothetical protein C5S39_03840 [Methanophagales archaeon]